MEPNGEGLPAETNVGRAALRVTDRDRMRQFYREVVGLTELETDSERTVLGAEEPILELQSAPEAPPRARSEAGLFHLAIRFPSRESLGAALVRVEEEWDLTGASDHRVSEALYLSDPEDNGVELYWDRPEREWPITDDGRVEMTTEPLDLESLRSVAETSSGAPAGTDLGHVHLEVSSLATSRAFYVDDLGLGVRQRMDDAALFLAAGTYHHHVGLNVWNGRTEPAGGRGLAWFELVVPDDAALDAVRERLDSENVEWRSLSDGIEVSDPDEIRVRLRVAN